MVVCLFVCLFSSLGTCAKGDGFGACHSAAGGLSPGSAHGGRSLRVARGGEQKPTPMDRGMCGDLSILVSRAASCREPEANVGYSANGSKNAP